MHKTVEQHPCVASKAASIFDTKVHACTQPANKPPDNTDEAKSEVKSNGKSDGNKETDGQKSNNSPTHPASKATQRDGTNTGPNGDTPRTKSHTISRGVSSSNGTRSDGSALRQTDGHDRLDEDRPAPALEDLHIDDVEYMHGPAAVPLNEFQLKRALRAAAKADKTGYAELDDAVACVRDAHAP